MKWYRFISPVIVALVLSLLCTAQASPESALEIAAKTRAERYFNTATTVHAPLYEPLAEQIVSDYNLSDKTGTGIDLGGGPGNLVVELALKTPRMHWINADINPHFFHYTRKLADEANVSHHISTLRADAQKLPLKNGSVDIVVSRGSFHLWNDKYKAFSEIYRVLKSGGTAYIGRGFSENLPVEVAAGIRARKRENGSVVTYDLNDTADEFETIMKTLEIDDYRIIIPRPPGSEGVRYGIWIEFHKYGPVSEVENVSPDEIEQSRNDEKPVFVLEPLEVRGAHVRDVIREPMTESPGLQSAMSVVHREEIEKLGADTVIEAMEYVPGAWIESRGRKVKQFFSVRGQKYPYPDYAIDGALYREFHELPYFFSSRDIDRIEIMRSSAAMLTGISGLGGVVNIIPREYTEPETSWEAEYSSFNTHRFHISHGGSARNISYALGLGAPHTNGPDGRHAAENMTNFYGNVHWKPSRKLSVRTTLFHLYGKRELAQAEPPASKRFQTSDERFDPIQATMIQMKAFYHASEKASTELNLSYANRDNTFISQTDSTHTGNRDWDFEWSMNLVQSLALSRSNTLRVGGFYNRWIAPYGKRFFTGRRTDLSTFSAVIVDEHRYGKFNIDVGLRWLRTYINEYGAYNINGSSKGFKNVPSVKDTWEPSIANGNVGASYALTSNLSLYANGSAGYIKPRTGTLDIELEEPETEQRVKLDAGVEITVKKAGEFSVTGFYVRQQDALVLSGKTEEVDGRINELWMNRDQDQLGIELEARSVQLYDIARIFFNITAIRSRVKSGGDMKRNEELPRVITGGGINLVRYGCDLNLYWKAISSYESVRFAASAPVPEQIGDYTTLNVTIGKSFGSKLRTRVYLEAVNLTDKEFSTVVGYPDYGRRYSIGIRQVL